MSGIFTEINYRIKNSNKREDEIHLGFYKFEDLTEDNKTELSQHWSPLSSTLYEREVDGVTFLIEIESEGVRGE